VAQLLRAVDQFWVSVSVSIQNDDVHLDLGYWSSPLPMAITPKHLDILDILYRCKNVRLGVNGNLDFGWITDS